MNEFLWFLLTVAVGIAGGLLAVRLKVPVGGILGAMFAVILLNLISGDRSVFYSELKIITQVTVGALAGGRVGRGEIRSLGGILVPMLIIFPLLLVYNLVFGLLVYQFSPLDACTSFFSLTPGNISDIAVIAEELGADRAVVALIHAMRLLVCSAVLPPIFMAVQKRAEASRPGETLPRQGPTDSAPPAAAEASPPIRCVGLFAAAACGGTLLRILGVRGGTIIGAMLFSMLYTCAFGKSVIPKWVKRCQQTTVGIYVGSGVTIATIMGVRALLVPVIILTVYLLFGTFSAALLVLKTKKLDLISSLACCAPGGVTEILLVTDELGGDISQVGTIHAFRFLVVVSIFPPVISWFITLLT